MLVSLRIHSTAFRYLLAIQSKEVYLVPVHLAQYVVEPYNIGDGGAEMTVSGCSAAKMSDAYHRWAAILLGSYEVNEAMEVAATLDTQIKGCGAKDYEGVRTTVEGELAITRELRKEAEMQFVEVETKETASIRAVQALQYLVGEGRAASVALGLSVEVLGALEAAVQAGGVKSDK